MPIIRLSPSGPIVDIDSLDMPEATIAGRPRGGGAGQAEALTPDQALQVLSEANIVIERWDFDGVIAAAGAIAVPGWAAFNAPVISQRDVGSTHSANHPGQLLETVDNTLANTGCVFYGPWDFSVVRSIKAAVLVPASGGVELSGTVLGFGLVQTPSTMATVALGRLWPTSNPSVYAMVRSTGSGAGFWQIHTSGGTTPGTSTTPVVANTWYDLEIRSLAAELGAGVWGLFINGTLMATRSLVPTSGIAYLAIGVVCNATPSGNAFCVDDIEVETFPLNRAAA